MLAERIAVLAKIYFSLSTLLLSWNASSLPRLLHSDVETGSQLSHSGRILLHLCALSLGFTKTCNLFTISANESTFLSPRSLFKNSSDIYMLLFMQNSHRLSLLITAQRKQMLSKIIVILDQAYF